MSSRIPQNGLQLTSTLHRDGTLIAEVVEAPVAAPGAHEVLIQVEATPISPADVMTLIPGVNPARADFKGSPAYPRVAARLPDQVLSIFAGRLDRPLAVGLEGAGTVVAVGEKVEHLKEGQRVAAMSMAGGMYSQYQTVAATDCVALPEGVTTIQGAATFSNPLTALAIVETLRQEGHSALIHTAAASSLGQMLAKICQEDGIDLVAVVRRKEHVELLQKLGVRYVCDSSSPHFRQELIKAVTETGARVAFDAVGGGDTAHQLLAAMEQANIATKGSGPHGSWTPKSVYIYGRLDTATPYVNPSEYGGTWKLEGWVMPAILEKAGHQRTAELINRIVSNITTTFATEFSHQISLADVLKRENIEAYTRYTTGERYLVLPNR